MSEEGREQAKLVGERLKKFSIDAVYSSDLIRAVQTADIINESLNVERAIDPRFMEADFGDLTGMSTEELKVKFKDFLDQRARMVKDEPYPGGENCEMVFKRSFAALEDLVKKDYSYLYGTICEDFSSNMPESFEECADKLVKIFNKIIDSNMSKWKYCPVCGGKKMFEPQESEDKE